MTYLLTLHHRPPLSVATTSPVVPADQIAPLQDALALADRLSALLADEQAALARAQAEGRAAGEATGYASGQSRALHEGAHALAEQLQRIATEQAAQRDELRQALVALASGMVRRIAADLAPAQVLAALAERAFDHVVPAQPVRLRVPAALLEPVRAQLAQRELALPVQCSADDSLHGLQCVVESAAGTLLAGLDDVLNRTTQALETSLRTRAQSEQDAGAAARHTENAAAP
ncbi:MAG: hypothetical protein KA914_01210 [Ottowia sp.]|nr:hypothetical protein [Ottowia sp.]